MCGRLEKPCLEKLGGIYAYEQSYFVSRITDVQESATGGTGPIGEAFYYSDITKQYLQFSV